MTINKCSKFFKLSFVIMTTILALVLIQTTTAFAGGIYGKCGKVYNDGKDDGYGRYSIQDVCLNSSNVVDSSPLKIWNHGWITQRGNEYFDHAISINNNGDRADYDFGNDSAYIFSDSDGHYDINRLSLVCEDIDLHYGLAFVYDTDTWDWDTNGESFHVMGDIVINNGEKVIPINYWFEDKKDSGSYDWMFIWQMEQAEFNKLIPGYKDMQSAIKAGVVSINLTDLECRSYNQGDDHWVNFDTSHLRLDSSSIEYGTSNPTIFNGRTNAKDDGRSYQFSDELDKTYRIYDLNLQAYTYDPNGDSDDSEEEIFLTYHTDTPGSDLNGEDFKCNFSIIVDGKVFKTFKYSFTDKQDQGGDEDHEVVWLYDTHKFVSEVGCSLGEGIANGRIVIQMDTLECDPC